MSEAEAARASGSEIEAALADPAFASLRLAGAPVLVIASDPARILYASDEAQRLFGGDAAALGRRLLHGAEPGALRLVALSRSLLPGAAPRLERLRFFFGPVAETVTVLCRRVASAGRQPLFALAVLGMRAPSQPADPVPLVRPEAEPASPAGAAAVEPAATSTAQRATRFAWRTDGDHVVSEVAPALAATVGAANAEIVGLGFVEAAARLELDPEGRLAAALAARDTFSGLAVSWPVADGAVRAPVTLGGAPVFDADERFVGFRGFGLIHPERIAAPVAPQIPAQEDAPAPEEKPAALPAADAIATATPEACEENAEDEAERDETIVAVTESGALVYGEPASSEAQDDAAPDEAEGASQSLLLDSGELAEDDAREDAAATLAADEQEDEYEAPEPEPEAPPANIVPLRPLRAASEPPPAVPQNGAAPPLSPGERSAFEEIARALGAEPPTEGDRTVFNPVSNRRARDLIDLVARFGRSDEPAAPAPATEPSQQALPTPVVDTPPQREEPAPPPVDALGRNALATLDRIPVGVVVSRFNVPIFANRTLLDLLDYADADAFHAAGGLDRLFHGRAPDSGAAQVETRDGELIPVDARVQAIEWDGQPATLVTLRRAPDQTDAARAKALELELRQRDVEARELHAILDTATDGVAVLDVDGRILSLNRAGEALFGCDQDEVAGAHFSTLVARESEEAVAQYLDGVRSGGVASVLNDGREILGRARQGGAIPIFMTLGRLGGATPKFCAVLRDLTAWKKAERELGDARREAERASALKSDFLAKVSHEIRTPLNAIIGFAEVIMEERFGPVGNDRYRDYMRDIHRSGGHVLSLVNDLLDLSKIEAGKVDLEFTSVDANAVVTECVSLMQPQATRDRVVIRTSLAPNLPNIVADERSLRQIVLNLLSNAVKFNEPGGQVIVSTALTDAGHAVVRIKDTGVGMNDAELETALEPFRQIATSRKGEGTGLGLPLTKALVEANRASFTIKSRKAEGTLVEVVFPPTRVLAE